MANLPVIVAMGGVNPAGRSSFHYSYRRLLIDRLPAAAARQTLLNLAVLTGMARCNAGTWEDGKQQAIQLDAFLSEQREAILSVTLIRQIEANLFDPQRLRRHANVKLAAESDEQNLRFTLPEKQMPQDIPENWQVRPDKDGQPVVTVKGKLNVLLKDSQSSSVNYAGQLPSGFDPASLYPSRNHPRGLQMAIYGISDALYSMGIDWEAIRRAVAPDQIGVYACSSMSQLDYNGNGGLLQARLLGRKVTSKQLPLGFGEMPADFINAYVLGNVGATGAALGACATFHYNLHHAVRDIRSGARRVVIVGVSEAPITPEILEGYSAMGAIASDEKLQALDAGAAAPDYRRACRPFGDNLGFTLGEASQFIVLFDDALALELGAVIHGSVNDVFVNADGFKKSIASPGIGNYLTFAKAAAATRAVLGEDSLRHRSFVQAHGTGTPQNRVTESAILADTARHFGIADWQVTAVKSHLGHSLGCAGADQLASSLGVWKYGHIPGILTIDAIADDVRTEGLRFLLQHEEVGAEAMDSVLLNAKGFGGNNATAAVLSPAVTRRMLAHKHGSRKMSAYLRENEKVEETAADYERRCNQEQVAPVYKFGHKVLDGEDLRFGEHSIRLEGCPQEISLELANPYAEMCD